MSRALRYFHGGPKGIRQFILPPAETGAACASDYGAAAVHRRDRVYVTTDLLAATMYAALVPNELGIVYEVEPVGALEADPDCDCLGLSFQCARARIIRPIPVKKRKLAKIRRAVIEA